MSNDERLGNKSGPGAKKEQHSGKLRFTLNEEERRRLAEFFILLDQMDRDQKAKKRNVA